MHGFGDLEAVVMDVVWDWGEPATVRDVFDHLAERRQIAYTTVMTVMDNLYRKGHLSRVKDGRAYRYTPTAERGEYTARIMREVLRSVEDQTATLSHFVAGMSEEESQELRAVLRRRSRRSVR
jgi:predicted transcriptional regulator